jgi:hypothetical protein
LQAIKAAAFAQSLLGAAATRARSREGAAGAEEIVRVPG